MPFVSKSQERWGNSPAGRKALGSKADVDEWNASTDYNSLPERVAPKQGALLKAMPSVKKVKMSKPPKAPMAG